MLSSLHLQNGLEGNKPLRETGRISEKDSTIIHELKKINKIMAHIRNIAGG